MTATEFIAPEKVWQELDEFKSTFNAYIKTQKEIAERERRKYFDCMKAHQEKLESLRQHEIETMNKIKEIDEEIKNDMVLIETLKKEIETIEIEEASYISQLESIKKTASRHIRQVELLNEEIEREERIINSKLSKVRQSVATYERLLSLKYSEKGDEKRWTFTNIDPKDPSRQFYFCVSKVDQKDIITSFPEIQGLNEAVSKFKDKPFSSFVIHIRRMFKKIVELEDRL